MTTTQRIFSVSLEDNSVTLLLMKTNLIICFLNSIFKVKVLFYSLDVFKMDPNFMENEEKYKMLKKGRGVCIHTSVHITHLQGVSLSNYCC